MPATHQPARFGGLLLVGTQPRSHELVCGSFYSLPKGPCPKGRADSGRSYPIVVAQLAAPDKERKSLLMSAGPLSDPRPFSFLCVASNTSTNPKPHPTAVIECLDLARFPLSPVLISKEGSSNVAKPTRCLRDSDVLRAPSCTSKAPSTKSAARCGRDDPPAEFDGRDS